MAANPLFDMVNRDRQQSTLPPVTNQISGGRNPLFDMVNSTSAAPRTTPAETPGLGTNILRAGQRGWHQLLTGVNVAALETGLGDEEDVADIARHQAAMQAPDIKPSAAYENFMRAEGFWNSLNELRKAPVDILSQLVTESFIASAPSFAAAAGLGAVGAGAGFLAGGPAGAAAGGLAGSRVGMGIGSASVEATAKLVEAIGDEGVDVTDPNELSAAMANDALMSKVRQKAIAKGVPIGVMDAVTFSLAGKFGGRIATRIGERAAASATGTALTDAAIAGGTSAARKQIASAATRAATAAAGLGAEQAAVREVARAAALAARPMRSKVGSYAAELGAQAAGGAIGEAISQPMAGEATNWPAIISEAAAEFGQTPVELAMSEHGRLTNLARRALAGQPITREEVAQAVREQSQQPTTQAPPVTQTSAEQQVTEAASQGRWTRGGRQFESEPPDIPLSKPAKEMTFDEFLQNIKVRIGDERDANSVWVLLNDHSDGFHMGGNQAQVRDPLKDAYESIVGKPAVDKTSTTAVTTETPAIDEQEVARRRREALGDISIPGESVPLSGLRPDISPITPAESATGLRRALDPIEVARYGSSEEARDVYQKYGRVGKKGPKNKRPMNWELLSALTLNGNTPDNILALIAERAQPEHAEVLENIANHPRAPRASVIASQRLQEFGLVAPEVEAPEQVFESENPVVQQVRDTINIKRLKTIARENSGELRDSAVDLALASKPNADDILLSFLVNRAEPSDTPVLDAIIGHQRASEETVATAVAKKNQRLGRGVVRPKGVAQRPLRRSTPLTTLPAHNETLPENNATLPTASQVELGAEIPAPVVEPSEQGEAAGNVSAAEAPVNPIPPTPEAANAPKEKGRVQVTPPAETPVPKSQAEGPVVPKRKISQSDFANTARRLVENGGKRIGELEWNVRGDRIEVNHYVTGRDYGYIDLKTGEMFPVRQQDKSKLQEVVNNINEEARQSLIRQELESARNYPFKNAKRIQALEQELTTPPPKSEVATAPTREAPAEEPVVPAEKRPRGVTKLAWDNEQARARAEATTKQPWEMTKEEWESARRDAATAEKNSFKGLSGSKFKEQFMWGTKARIRLEYGASPEPIRKGGVPVVTHRAVVQKALSEGKPIPPEVQAEYPDLFPKGASNAEAVRSNAGQISPRGAERQGGEEESGKNLQQPPSESPSNRQAQEEVEDTRIEQAKRELIATNLREIEAAKAEYQRGINQKKSRVASGAKKWLAKLEARRDAMARGEFEEDLLKLKVDSLAIQELRPKAPAPSAVAKPAQAEQAQGKVVPTLTKAKTESVRRIKRAHEVLIPLVEKERLRQSDKRKKDIESLWETIRTHANKLGITPRKIGTWYDASEYLSAADEVVRQLPKVPPTSAVAKPAPEPSSKGPQPTWTLAEWNSYRDANKPLAKSLSDHLKEWVAAKLPIRRELFDSDTSTERIAGNAQRESGYRVNNETGMFEPPAKEKGAGAGAAEPSPFVEEEEGDEEILAEEQEPEEVRKALAEEKLSRVTKAVFGKASRESVGIEEALEQSDVVADSPRGSEGTVFTPDNEKVEFAYRLVPISGVITSHDMQGNLNPDYPQDMQPRSKDEAPDAYIDRVQGFINNKINPELLGESKLGSDGAPIITPSGHVLSGNTRVNALELADASYKEQSAAYRKWLADNAERFGFTEEQVKDIPNAILVRELIGDLSTERLEALGEKFNVSNVATKDAADVAKSDAKNLTYDMLEMLYIEEMGDINKPVNAPFVSKFLGIIPESERGKVFQNGKVTQDGIARIRNAILQKAYGRDMVMRVGVSTDDNVRNVSSALVRIAPQAARVKALIDSGKIDQIDPMPQIAAAADVLSGLRAAGLADQIQAIAQNATLLTGDNESLSGLTDFGRMLLSMYDMNKNSAKAIGDILSRFFTLIENSPRVGQESLVPLEPIPIEQHFSQAKKDVKAAGQKSLLERINEAEKGKDEAAQGIRDYFSKPRDTNTLGMGRILTKDDLKFIADVAKWVYNEMIIAWYKGYQAGKGFFLTQKEVLDHYRQQINGRPKKKEIEVVKQQYEAFVADKRKQLMAKEAAEAATEEPKSVAPPRVPPKQGTQTELGVDDESLGVDFVPLEDTLGQRVDRMLENFEFEMVSKGQPFSMFDKVFAAIQNVAQYGDANTEEAEAAKKRLQEGQFPLADNPENPVSGAAVGTRGAYDRNVAMTQFYYDTFRAMFKDVFVRFAGEWKPEGGFNVADMRRFLRYVYAVSQLARYEAAEVPLGENALATARRAVKDASSSLSPERKAIYDKYAQEYFNTWNNMLKQLASLFPSMEPFLRRISNDFDTPYIPNIYQTENDIVLEEVGRMRGGKRLVEELKGGGDFTQVRDPLAQAMLTMRALITASMKNQIKANMVTMQRFGNALSRKAAETLGLTIESKGRQLDEMVTRVREWIGPDAKFVSDETLRNLIKYFQEPTEIGGRVMVNYYAEDGSTTQIAVPVKTALAFDAFTSPALPLWFNLLYRLPVQVFKVMTTGASLAFGGRNLVKDVGTGAVQRYSKTQGWEAFRIWLNTLTTLAKNNDAKQIAKELGIAYGSWINAGNDRATADLAEMFGIETAGSKARSIVERFEMFLSTTEVVTRAAEGANVIVTNIRNGSYKVGNFKDPSKVSLRGNQLTDGTTTMRLIDAWHQLSREQMDEIFVAEQRVSTDFRDMGRTSQTINQMVPYFGAAVGGMRQMVRAYRGDKNAFVMRAGMYILIPTLVSWWLNKDEDWYKDQDAVGKYMNWQFKMGDTIVRIPKPQDVGHLFGTIPEAILNSLYQQDKDEVVRMMKPVMEQLMPFSVTPIGMLSDALGPIGKTIVEQYANKNVFTGREIVPKSEIGLLPVEQAGPWTSQFATMIASAMNATPGAPDYLKSPRRVDHIVRGIFGRVPYEWGDAFVFLGNPTKWGEKANIPAVGAFFQRGGTGGVTSLAQNQVYDDAITLQSYQQSRRFKLTPAQERYLERLNSTKSALGIMRIEMRNANTPRLRRDIGDEMRRIAQETIATRPENMEPEPFSAEELRIRTAKRIIEGAADLVRQKVKDELRARRPNLPDDKLDAYVQRMLGRDHRMRKLSQLRRFVKIASEQPSERAMRNLDIAEQQAKFIIGEFTGVQPQ